MREAIAEMSRKGLGITAVTEGVDRLAGVITDGDIRRLLERGDHLLERTAGACMTRKPKTIAADDLASAALKMMEDHHITALFVCDADGAPRRDPPPPRSVGARVVLAARRAAGRAIDRARARNATQSQRSVERRPALRRAASVPALQTNRACAAGLPAGRCATWSGETTR